MDTLALAVAAMDHIYVWSDHPKPPGWTIGELQLREADEPWRFDDRHLLAVYQPALYTLAHIGAIAL